MKFNETQKNLIALLPAHEIIDKLTDSAKLVLAQIDLLHGTDFAMENGYVYTTNERLCKDTGIKARQTIITAVKVLRKLKLIELESGGRHKANRYRLTDLYYELSGDENPFKNQANEIENQAKEEVPKNKNQAVDIELELDIEIEKEPELEKELNINQTIVHVTEDKNENTMNDMKINQTNMHENPVDLLYDDELYEILEQEPDREEEERIRKDYINSINNGSINDKPQIRSIDNDYVTWVFDKYDYFLDELFKARSREMYKHYAGRLIELTHNLQKEKFTEPQWNVVLKKFNRWEGIEKCNRYSGMAVPSHNTSIEKTENTTKKVVADEDNEMMFRAYCTDEELIAMGFEVEEPMVAYGNSSVQEAQQQFAMALAANG